MIRTLFPVHQLFAAGAAGRPDHTAVVSAGRRISYAELESWANRLAQVLSTNGVGPGSVVMVHLERSIETVVSLLATLKAGAAYLPVEPGVPDGRLAVFVKETGCATVLANECDRHRFADLPVAVIQPAADAGSGSTLPETNVDGSDVAYVIYTSGSTGTPKGVAVTHDSLSHQCREVVKRYGITSVDRVLQLASLSFDTSIEQILVTLLSGATLVLPEAMWAPSELSDRLCRHGVTVMDLTPAYWRAFLSELALAPVDLPLRLTIVGGEAVRAEDCREALRLLPGVRLINAYGLTETTITSCTMEISELTLPERGVAPVGRPLPGTTVHVLDERLRPVGPGEVGEVYVGGRGVARGYLLEESPARARFLPDRFGPGERMYRTGDLGRWTEEGNLSITGRVDRQVKIRGFRVEPGEVETHLAAHDLIDDVVLKVCDRDREPRLVAYYTAPKPLRTTELRAFLGQDLPDHLVPDVFLWLPELPLRPNGKVDLDALPEPRSLSCPATSEPSFGDGPDDDLLDRGVAMLWCQVLKADRVGPADNFFDLGGNSILAAELLAKVRATFGILLTQVRPLIRLLLEDATPRGFAAAVRAARAGSLGGDDPGGRVDFAAESALGVPIARESAASPRRRDPAHVLLTGATGFLGIYLLRELLTTTGATVHCLVRAGDRDLAMERIRTNALRYLRDDLAGFRAAGRIVAHAGDLAEPLLGLPEAEFDTLARTVDVIHHLGGQVNFIYPYANLRATNVDGTREIIRLAARHRNVPVHYVSTMAVIAGFGTAGVRRVTESTPAGHADHLSVGYVESKWVAEALLREAAERGLPVAIYRAADISGDQVTGAWNTATEMCAMKRFIVDAGVAPIAELPLDYTPVDTFAAAMVHIAARGLPDGEVYHLTNPGKVNIAELADRFRAYGFAVRDVLWGEWLDRLVTVAVEQPDHPMTPFAPLFIDRCATGAMSVAEMYLENTFPVFTRSNVDNALRGSGIEIPPVDAAMLDRYIGYLISVGFLRAPR